MNARERGLLDKTASAVESLLLGESPREIDTSGEGCGEEVRKVCEAVNRLVTTFGEARRFVLSLSEGKLEVESPPRNFLVSAFKQLHVNLRHLTWQTQQIARGDLNQRVDFLGEFSTSFNAMIESLREKKGLEDALQRTNELLERQATTDTLTGIANRLKFNNTMAVEVSKARRHLVPLSLIIFDVDNFKLINDTFGHRAGDLALQELATLVSPILRPEDVFARWGGEEFAILLPYTDGLGAVNLAERLCHKIQMHPFSVVNALTCSFGVALFCTEENEDSFVRRADGALYEAKKKGRNRVEMAKG
jgi:two-component system cell cycle response regulator